MNIFFIYFLATTEVVILEMILHLKVFITSKKIVFAGEMVLGIWS
jgi:hypothetical protein